MFFSAANDCRITHGVVGQMRILIHPGINTLQSALQHHALFDDNSQYRKIISCLFVLRFYGPVNPRGHVERGQFT